MKESFNMQHDETKMYQTPPFQLGSHSFFRKIKKLESKLQQLQKKREFVFNVRILLATLSFATLAFIILIPGIRMEGPLLAVTIPVFVYLVILSDKLKRSIEKHETLLHFYKRQNDRINSVWPESTVSEVYKSNPLARDLDLFESTGLLSLIDETFTTDGKNKLCESLISPQLDLDKILKEQSRVEFLAHWPGPVRKFLILGQLETKTYKKVREVLSNLQNSFVSDKFRIVGFGLILLWILAVLEFLQIIKTTDWWLRILFSIASLSSLKSLNDSYQRALSVAPTISSFRELLSVFDRWKVSFQVVPSLKDGVFKHATIRFEKWLSFLTVNSHPLIVILLNVIIPWNFIFTLLLEKHREKLQKKLPILLDELSDLEKSASFSLLRLYHKTSWPVFENDVNIDFADLKHPLGDSKFVCNSLRMSSQMTILLTGSNMSGKSTFLRTIGANQVLALAGAPVFAKKLHTFVGPVLSAIRISDSLRDGASYFYAEVMRLKELLGASKLPSLYLVDEIFRGTNNQERLIGSRELIRALNGTPSLGLVSTHDLELSELEKTHSKIQNWHFTDRVVNGHLVFDYTLKRGPSPSTNALVIMRMAGLPVP